MRSIDSHSLTRNDKILILVHDHGLEHGPTAYDAKPERLNPASIYELATHDAVTGLAVYEGLAETYYPSRRYSESTAETQLDEQT